MGKVSILPSIGTLFCVPFLRIAIDPLCRRVHGHVRFNKRAVKKEWILLLSFDEFKGLLKNPIRGICCGPVIAGNDGALGFAEVSGNRITIDRIDALIVIKKRRKERVGVSLAVVAIEAVEPLADRGAGGVGRPEAPFPESSCRLALRPEGLGDGDNLRADRPLAGKRPSIAGVSVIANFSVAEMTAGHEDTTGRGANRSSGVVSEESDPLTGKSVNIRGFYFRLTVAPELAPSEVIGEDENDVGPRVVSLGRRYLRS